MTYFSKELLKAAKSGDSKAELELAECYFNGMGTPMNQNKAIKWYKKAAKAGLVGALEALGGCYFNGEGVKANYEEAAYWWEKAVEAGSAVAAYDLACCYVTSGRINDSNGIAVVRLLKTAAESNIPEACYKLGELYELGRYVGMRDPKTAEEYFRLAGDYSDAESRAELLAQELYSAGVGRALGEDDLNRMSAMSEDELYKIAKLGIAEAQYRLALRYESGDGAEKNPAAAVLWYEKAAAQGHTGAMCNLGCCYENGEGTSQSCGAAFMWYKKAAEKKDSAAMYNLGRCYEHGVGTEKNIKAAKEWYEKAAELGNARAMACLSHIYQWTYSFLIDEEPEAMDSAAFSWAKKSADAGDAYGMYCLADCYLREVGVACDNAKAYQLYKRSAELGCPDAMSALGAGYFHGEYLEKNERLAYKWLSAARAAGEDTPALNMLLDLLPDNVKH